MTSAGKHYDNILQRLTAFEANVNRSGQLGRTNIHKDAERLFCYPLELMFGGKFINLNTVEPNYPAVDLGCADKRICVQVTSDNDHEKIQSTLDKFFLHGKDQSFDRLIVLIIGDRKKYKNKNDTKDTKYQPFTLNGSLNFDADRDIWGTNQLLEEIDKLPEKKLKQLSDFLDTQLESTGAMRPYLYLPPDSALGEGFVGREEELLSIRSQLDQDVKPVVLSGLGGIGKTVLASRFGRLYPDGEVYFIRFQTSFTATITGLYGKITPAPIQPPTEKEQLEAVMKLLSRCTENDLLIFDNVDADSGDLSDLMKDEVYKKLRQMKPRMILTTRFDRDRAIPIGRIDDKNLKEIFRTHGADLTDPQMNDLIEAVNGHTMTIDLIARTLNGKGWRKVTAKDMLRAIRGNTLPSEKYRKIATDYNQSEEQAQIYQHLSVVFDVTGVPENGQNVLRCATLLPEGGMEGETFGISLPEDQQDSLDELLDHGWLSMESDLLRIHPVIRLVCREELKPTDETCRKFLNAAGTLYSVNKNNTVIISQLAQLFSQASDMLLDKEGRWSISAGVCWNCSGDAEKALKYNERIIKRAETEVLSIDVVIGAYNNAGSAYDKLGNHKQALTYHSVALSLSEKFHPNDSLKNKIHWNNIGASFSNLGDYEKALEYKLKALEVLRKQGPGSKELAICLDNIGVTYRDMGKIDKALQYHLEALTIFEKEENVELAIALDNIGGIYDIERKYSIALKFKLRALRILKKIYSGRNIDLALAYGNISATHAAKGDINSAVNYIEKALHATPEGHPKMQNYQALRDIYLNMLDMHNRGIPFMNPFENI